MIRLVVSAAKRPGVFARPERMNRTRRLLVTVALAAAAAAAVFVGGVWVGVKVWPGDEGNNHDARRVAEAGAAWERFLAPPQRPVLPRHREIGPGEDPEFLRGVLDKIFPDGRDGLTDERKAVEIMRYVVSSMRLKSNAGTATKLIRDGYSICGGLSLTFRVLCRLAGIPAKYVGMMNLPGMRSHAISEVYYDGGWHFFDATFGIFLYSKDRYDKTGRIVSFHDMLSDPTAWTAFQVVGKPWTGTYDADVRAFGVRKCGGDYLKEHYGEDLIGMYHGFLRITFPVAYDLHDVVSFPVDADLRETPRRQFGKIDQSGGDVVGDSLTAGSHYLGGAGPSGFHTWLIRTPGACTVHITYHYYGAAAEPPELRLVPLRAVKRKAVRRQGNAVTFDLLVSDAEAVAAVFCPQGAFLVDAMQIRRD